MRISRIAPAVLLVTYVVAACGPLPKPFQPPPGSERAELVAGDVERGVRVVIVAGATQPMAKLLTESVAKTLIERGIPAVTEGGQALRYRLIGRVETFPPGQYSGVPARIHWELADKKLGPFFTFAYDVNGTPFDWQWGSPKLIADVGEATGRLITDAIEPEDESLKPAAPVTAGIWVRPIRGAPGDGDKSLTRAIRYALTGAKVAVTSESAAARHILEGKIQVERVVDNKQKVGIRWTVRYPDGAVVGHAVQRNEVPAGTFDGRWGETASIIAAAAVGGIKDVLNRAEETVRFRIATDKRLKTDIVGVEGPPVLPPPALPPPNLAPDPAGK